ncbi:MAG TPA: hypothetical protein VFS10_11190 [Pyrinomonadaceae bacterium]|nr:hypothetical protein [Pyrinomonadaceae bacterium]
MARVFWASQTRGRMMAQDVRADNYLSAWAACQETRNPTLDYIST